MLKIFHRAFAIFVFGFALAMVQAQQPGPVEQSGKDVLAYKDGDRVQGRLVEQTVDTIVFNSDRFGLLRVAVGNAVVIRSTKPPAPIAKTSSGNGAAAAPGAKPESSAERAEAEKASRWEWLSPAMLTARLANYFGPWHGKIAFSTEVVSDTAERNNVALETLLQRKWTADEVQLKGRYDYSKTNELTTTDLLKADGLWRHDFPNGRFALYRPTIEWNRANFILSTPADYVLMQQEIGVGLNLLAKPNRKVRVGVSENLFDVWNTSPPASHSSRTSESTFLETEFKLPWRMSLTQRAVYYYSIASGHDGWESSVDLSKKFSETFSTSLRYEVRHDNPDGRAPDYTRLKLLFGLDF